MTTKVNILLLMAVTTAMLFTGCKMYTTHGVQRVITAGEDSIVFVRPDSFSILGTRSIRDHLEITYERLTKLPNGFVQLEVGVRNRGGQHWWDQRGLDVQLSATPKFYNEPVQGTGFNKPPVYVGERKTFTTLKGETTHLTFVCPVQNVIAYQLVLAER